MTAPRWTMPLGASDVGRDGEQLELVEAPAAGAPATSEDIELAAQKLEASQLKGEELEKALEDADLPKTGTADEKRARLAEHLGTTSKG